MADRHFKVTVSEKTHGLIETLLRQLVDDHAAGDEDSHAENEAALSEFLETTEEVDDGR